VPNVETERFQGAQITFSLHEVAVGKSFHEKAGHSQGGFVFTYRESLPLSQAASDAILPSALLVER
jgi:hypothetical protein